MSGCITGLAETFLATKLPGGYSYPLTPTGKGNLLCAPPWHFVASEMVIRYQADPEQVKRFLPAPLEPSKTNPGGCILHMCSYVSRNENADHLVDLPELCNYTETYLEIRGNYRGTECKHFAYYWVDRDYSILRGWVAGLPKKFGNTSCTFEKIHLFQLNPHFPQFGENFRMVAVCSAHMEKLISGSIALDKKIDPDDIDPEMRLPCRNLMMYPDGKVGYTDRAVARITHTCMDVWYGDVWKGKDEELTYFPSVAEEHDLLKPLKIEDSYYMNYAFTTYGHLVDEDLMAK